MEAYGYHLDMPAGTSVRFEPGDTKTIKLVHIGGHKVIRGGSSVAPGPIDTSRAEEILRRLQQNGFSHTPAPSKPHEPMEPCAIDRQTYASMFGPTVGDLVRLGVTDLWVKVEKDHIGYGDECTFRWCRMQGGPDEFASTDASVFHLLTCTLSNHERAAQLLLGIGVQD